MRKVVMALPHALDVGALQFPTMRCSASLQAFKVA